MCSQVIENDSDDDRILECVLNRSTDGIVSDDQRLLSQEQRRHILVVTAREPLTILGDDRLFR